MVMITRGGIIPAGLLAESMQIQSIYTASVDFPAEIEQENQRKERERLLSWPQFIQFPEREATRNKKVLIVDDVWGSGRTVTAVKNRLTAAGAQPFTCVLHFNPYRNLFGTLRPDFYAAITDAHIIYPWEVQRGKETLFQDTKPIL